MKTTFIYALKDPNTSETRYVGKANNPIRRFGQHQRLAAAGKRSHLYNWFRSCGGIPILEILASVPQSCWQFFERSSIYWGGDSLTNATKGGDGGAGGSRACSEETRQKISQALSGKNHFLFGTKLSKNWKENIGRGQIGRKGGMSGKRHSEIAKQKMSARAKASWERRKVTACF